jgi:hypothetical protein
VEEHVIVAVDEFPKDPSLEIGRRIKEPQRLVRMRGDDGGIELTLAARCVPHDY